ncbi:tautomerase family protein [Comamonas sp. J-3]|uniref:tautomerase family protein n=1 Tax=Comamonas trifloxystrobinivorans TaxID=3350256 RepID=UPI00372C8EF1
MPTIHVEMTAGRSQGQKAQLAQAITEAMVQYSGCTLESVQIVFCDIDAQNWVIGGRFLGVNSEQVLPQT